jgi:hypothetical protein
MSFNLPNLPNLPPVYILCHPEYEPIRYQLLLSHLPKRGIPLEKVHWVRGPWGTEITSEDFFKVYDPFRSRYGLSTALSFKSAGLLRGEVSLVLTFYKAIQDILQTPGNPNDIVMIFESDVILREDFLERLELVLKDVREWDYISLGEGVGTRPKDAGFSYFSETKLYSPDHQFVFRCTDSMLFRRSFLEKLRQTLLPFRECLDWELNVQMLLHRGISFWADPPLVEPGSGRSRTLSLLPG